MEHHGSRRHRAILPPTPRYAMPITLLLRQDKARNAGSADVRKILDRGAQLSSVTGTESVFSEATVRPHTRYHPDETVFSVQRSIMHSTIFEAWGRAF